MSNESRFPPDDYLKSLFYHFDCIDLVTKDHPPEWYDVAYTHWLKEAYPSVFERLASSVKVGFEETTTANDLIDRAIKGLKTDKEKLAEEVAQGIIGA